MGFQDEDGGIEQVRIMLKRLADIPSIADEAMEDLAGRTRQMAEDMAPIEYGDLKKAIRLRRRGAGGRFTSAFNGVSSFEIFIDNNQPVSEPSKGVETVGEYAWEVHEYMGYGDTQGAPRANGTPFNPSKKSREAGEAKGVDAGGKFIERAGIAAEESMHDDIAKVVLKYI